MTDGPIFKAEDGSLWRWNAFRSDLQRLAAVSTAEQLGTSAASEPNPSVEVERLREALEPFVSFANDKGIVDDAEGHPDDESAAGLFNDWNFEPFPTWGAFRRARAALSRKQEPGVPTPGGEGE